MTELEHYKLAYKQEKLRADLLQDDLNSVDILHYDEVASLKNKIEWLELRLKEIE